MTIVKYSIFIARSKDGFIADDKNKVDFLYNIDIKGDAGYRKYYDSIDALVFGVNTFKFIIDQKLEHWPYKGKISYVLTNHPHKMKPQDDVVFFKGSVQELHQKIKGNHESIWVMGGANLIKQYIDSDMIGNMIISEVNVSIGSGIKLFVDEKQVMSKFELIDTEDFGDILNKSFVFNGN